MAWRKWIVRGVVYGILGVCGLGALAYQRWTNPAAVREQVMAKFGVVLPGAVASVDSARLRLLGGIQLNDLRLTRRDDPEQDEFLHAPKAVVYHDKESILEGKLLIRKMELYRPRVRVRRERDGTWNVQGLTPRPNLDQAIPTIVIHQGTVVIEDHLAGSKAGQVEIGDVSLTLINDPLPTVTIRGGATADLLGKLGWHGTWQRRTNDVTMTVKAADVPVNGTLLARAAAYVPGDKLAGLVLDARADVQAQVAYRKGASVPLSYDVRAHVRRGALTHPQIPLPLQDLAATVQCCNGEVRVESAEARSGKARLSLRGGGLLPAIDQDFEAQVEIKHLTLGDELRGKLDARLAKLHDLYQPNGPATVVVACARRGGHWAALSDGRPSLVSLRPEKVAMAFVKFPYPLRGVTGAIDYNLLDKHVRVDVTGYAGAEPVFITGSWTGEKERATGSFDIRANKVAIDDALVAALPEEPGKVVRSFHPTGQIDVKAHIRRDAGAPEGEFRNEYHISVHHAHLRWDQFPYPLENVSGVIDVYPRHLDFHDFQGTHRGGHILVHGKATPRVSPAGEKMYGVAVEITGRDVALDDELHRALRPLPGLYKTWETFAPHGRLTFTAAVQRPTKETADLEIDVDARGGAVRPKFFPYPLTDLSGHFHYKHHRLELTKLQAKHGGTKLALDDGAVDLHPGGGYYADLVSLKAERLLMDADLVAALPGKLQDTARGLKMEQPVWGQTRLVVRQAPEPGSPPEVFWDGQLWLKDATLTTGLELSKVTGTLASSGNHNGRHLAKVQGNLLLKEATAFKQPFQNVQANFTVHEKYPDVLLLGLRAPVFDGDVTGTVRVDFNSTTRYELNLTASHIDLARLARHNLGEKSEISGRAGARLHLQGHGGGADTLEGNGTVDVPNGKLKQLPFLLDLLKFLGLHWPDRTLFEEMHADFGILGRRATVRRLELIGNAVSLTGQGEFNLDGTDVQLDFYPTWARIEQLLPALVKPLPLALSKSVLTIEARGRLGGGADDLRFHKKFVPIVVDPLMQLRDRVAPVMERRE